MVQFASLIQTRTPFTGAVLAFSSQRYLHGLYPDTRHGDAMQHPAWAIRLLHLSRPQFVSSCPVTRFRDRRNAQGERFNCCTFRDLSLSLRAPSPVSGTMETPTWSDSTAELFETSVCLCGTGDTSNLHGPFIIRPLHPILRVL